MSLSQATWHSLLKSLFSLVNLGVMIKARWQSIFQARGQLQGRGQRQDRWKRRLKMRPKPGPERQVEKRTRKVKPETKTRIALEARASLWKNSDTRVHQNRQIKGLSVHPARSLLCRMEMRALLCPLFHWRQRPGQSDRFCDKREQTLPIGILDTSLQGAVRDMGTSLRVRANDSMGKELMGKEQKEEDPQGKDTAAKEAKRDQMLGIQRTVAFVGRLQIGRPLRIARPHVVLPREAALVEALAAADPQATGPEAIDLPVAALAEVLAAADHQVTGPEVIDPQVAALAEVLGVQDLRAIDPEVIGLPVDLVEVLAAADHQATGPEEIDLPVAALAEVLGVQDLRAIDQLGRALRAERAKDAAVKAEVVRADLLVSHLPNHSPSPLVNPFQGPATDLPVAALAEVSVAAGPRAIDLEEIDLPVADLVVVDHQVVVLAVEDHRGTGPEAIDLPVADLVAVDHQVVDLVVQDHRGTGPEAIDLPVADLVAVDHQVVDLVVQDHRGTGPEAIDLPVADLVAVDHQVVDLVVQDHRGTGPEAIDLPVAVLVAVDHQATGLEVIDPQATDQLGRALIEGILRVVPVSRRHKKLPVKKLSIKRLPCGGQFA
jgi:hypothetical protein